MRTLRLIRGHLDGGRSDVHTDYEALPREESLVLARQTLERLYAGRSDPRAGLPDVPADRCDVHSRFAYGLCQECGRKTLARFRYGAFELCRGCVRRRRNALRLLTEEARAA